MSVVDHSGHDSGASLGSESPGAPDPERLLDGICSQLEAALASSGMTPAAAKANVVDFLLATGTEDDDYLYFDGENDNSLPHRRHAARLAGDLSQANTNDPVVLDCLGMSLIRLGEYQRALDCYTKVAGLGSEKGISWNNVAWCQFRLGRLTEAQAAVEHAIRLIPEHAYLWHDRACILMSQGMLDQSLTTIRHARKGLSPKAPQLTYLQACVHERSGHRAAAIAAWKEYLEEVTSFPSHFRAFERALKHLEQLRAGLWRWQVRRLRTRMGPPQTSTSLLLQILGLSTGDPIDIPPSQDESRSAQANELAMRGWRLFQRRSLSDAASLCRRAMEVWSHCALARVLDARLALQRRDAEAYDKYVALAAIEQLFPPLAPIRARALAEFVFFMMCVHAEKLFLDGEYDLASKQVAEIERIAPGNPMADNLRRLITSALTRKCTFDTYRERACASSPLSMPTYSGSGFSLGRRW